jgi:hypothetical protein
MPFLVRSGGPVVKKILCQTHEQAKDMMDALNVEYRGQEFTVVRLGDISPGETETLTAPSRTGYGLKPARFIHPRPPARADRGHKSGNRGLSSGGRARKRKPKKKQGGKH